MVLENQSFVQKVSLQTPLASPCVLNALKDISVHQLLRQLVILVTIVLLELRTAIPVVEGWHALEGDLHLKNAWKVTMPQMKVLHVTLAR